MAIIRFSPFRNDPFQLQRQFFAPMLGDDEWPELTMTDGLDVYEEDNAVVVKAAVPGIPEEKIDITYEDGVLHIAGRQEEKEEEKEKKRVVHKMQRVTSFNYATTLPRAIDANKIDATVKDGVLMVRAPVAEAAKAKKISVKKSK